MLKLKRVELQGFKSFCDRTEMRFNGTGIAAVVGPNGCGKSNLSDAISWVLGEQSAKSLRGSRMADVIFSGTSTRKPVGMASVTMTLVDPAWHIERANGETANGTAGNGHGTNGHGEESGTGPETAGENGHAGDASGHGANGYGPRKPREITITRRLYRSGESEYLIDGKLARLRDIQDLFMGTGLGPESYAIIEQGRIGQILSSRPQDRRAVIEEAAGIGRFKAKRRLSEAKLEGARQNLSRVFDILEEVNRQVNSLNRQAKKAERYKKLHAGMIVELRRTLSGRYRLLQDVATRTAAELKEATAGYQELTTTVSGKEKEQSDAQRQAYELEAELTRTRERLAQIRLESERTRGRIEAQARQIQDIELRLTQGETESRTLEKRSEELAVQLEEHGRAVAALEEKSSAARQELAAKEQERQTAQNNLRECEQLIETSRKTVLRLLNDVSQCRNELNRVEEYLASVDRDAARAGREFVSSGEELEKLEAAEREVTGKLDAQRRSLETIAAERGEVERELGERKSRLSEARHDLDRLRTQNADLRARKQSLDEILSHRAYTTESVKRFFTAVKEGKQTGLEPLGVLADFVDVDAEYEKAAEEFLHDELEYILVRGWSDANKGIDLMRRELDGRATFLVHPEPGLSFGTGCPEPPLGPETGIVTRLSSVLRMTNGLTHAPTELIPRIARCMIAESHEAARRLAQQYPDFYFLLAGGVCYHGYAVSGGKKSTGGPLALKRELRELSSLLASRGKALEEAAALVKTLDEEISGLNERLERIRTSQQQQEKEVVAVEIESRKLRDEQNRTQQRRRIAQDELTRLARDKESAVAKRDQLTTRIEEQEQAREAQERVLEETRASFEKLQALVSRLSDEHSALRVQLAEREERRRAERNAQQRIESQATELEKRRQDLSASMERLGVERARLLDDNIELDRKAAVLAEEMDTCQASVAKREAAEGKLRETLQEMDDTLKQLRLEVQEAQENRSRIEVALAERRSDLKHLEETCIKELRLTLHELAETETDELDEMALAEAEEKYELLRTRIESLGPVNPAALEEYEEAKQRYDFLNAQRQDLLDSIRDTEKAIKEIDTETKRRFESAFEKINDNFRHTFKLLFGGGMGEMRLSDPENPGESGIDVVASPPGKRLQNVLLLSGGEKALTALSLLMAIFQYQPSPFCVLDEVDAPLDEANIQRMIRLLRGMASQTQFVVITHAKTTMGAAESLYGVTMQEPGVSKLVSVKFQGGPEAQPQVPHAVAAARPS